MSARLAGFTETTAVLGGAKVMKVRQWAAYSQPSDTYFEVRARVTTTKGQVQGIANGFSDTIEALLAAPDYTDVSWAQDVSPSGQLISVYTVYWTIPELEASGFTEVPAGSFNIDAVAQLVLADAGS
jgi:hypothetical protein